MEETDIPDYGADPHGKVTPLTAHIRLANPRTASTEKNRILRRGYNFSQGFTPDGQLDQGLLFVCYQRSLADGFLAVQERLNGEALEEYITTVGGGFFYVLPGVTTADGWLGEGAAGVMTGRRWHSAIGDMNRSLRDPTRLSRLGSPPPLGLTTLTLAGRLR